MFKDAKNSFPFAIKYKEKTILLILCCETTVFNYSSHKEKEGSVEKKRDEKYK